MGPGARDRVGAGISLDHSSIQMSHCSTKEIFHANCCSSYQGLLSPKGREMGLSGAMPIHQTADGVRHEDRIEGFAATGGGMGGRFTGGITAILTGGYYEEHHATPYENNCGDIGRRNFGAYWRNNGGRFRKFNCSCGDSERIGTQRRPGH